METQRRIGLPDVQHGRARRFYPMLAPLRYLRIIAPYKARYDFWLPTSIALVIWLGYLWVSPGVNVFGVDGVLQNVQSLLVMAVPFLIGALATVAMASPAETLDKRPVGAPLTLDSVVLSTRQFVCYLLGYLSFIGFVALIMIFLAKASKPKITSLLIDTPSVLAGVEHLTVLSFAWILAAFCLTMFWALYFLTDVVNRR